jgi:uronate dehydrogenase
MRAAAELFSPAVHKQLRRTHKTDRVSAKDPVRPKNLYGVTKCFGEALGSYFATQENLSVIVVRIANFAEFAPGQTHSPRDISAFLSAPDAVQLIAKAIDTELARFV